MPIAQAEMRCMVLSRLELCAGATVTSIGKAAAEGWQAQPSYAAVQNLQVFRQKCTAGP